MKNYILFLSAFLSFWACANKKIEITTDYIINPNWTKQNEKVGANNIEIKKMHIKRDSILNPFADVSQDEILSKLEVDSNSIYFANVIIKPSDTYKHKKIYFDRENDFYWIKDKYGNERVKVIGKLELNNWYEISKLNYYSFFVYIDSLSNVRRYTINQANY